MSDLISRQAAIDVIISESTADGAYGYIDTKNAVDLIKKLPSARPTGEWIPCEHEAWRDGVHALRCSLCNSGWHLNTERVIGTWNFCPNCGAAMRKG